MNEKRYFKHDTNARSDLKILKLRKKYGANGYGIFFMLLELLCCDTKHELEKDYELISLELQEDEKIIKSVVEEFDLFVVRKDKFYSKPFKKRMRVLDNIREGWSKGGKNRWKKGGDDESIYREFKG
jgi:hypothetical protein